jgi:Sulfotransferase domain
MVISHERSGTHFMMNAMAACFDYVSFPWLDLDRKQFNINYYHAQSLQMLILKVAETQPANILKSHHEFSFFSDIIASFKGAVEIIYIYRNPADVMASYWRFLHTWNWVEGPKADTALDFANAAPMGQLMRLQFRQYDTMLDRWANHVGHWTEAGPRIHAVKYEDLAQRYDDTIKDLGSALGLTPRQIVRPSRDRNVVQQGNINFAPPPGADNRAAVTELAMTKFPDLMARLAYS